MFVHVHDYDTWNADSTLAIIILPLLKKVAESKHGAPNTDDEDVPENLRSTPTNIYETSPTHFEKWDWIVEEMIWTFEQLHSSNDWESLYHDEKGKFDIKGHQAHQERINKGLILFGKYYQCLWT